MAIGLEGVKGAGMTYQGSSSTAEVRENTQAKVERTENIAVSDQLAANTVSIDVKATDESANGFGNSNQNMYEQKQAQIKEAVEELNKRAFNSEAIFGFHEGTNRVTIKIVDKTTKKVIKELPAEKTLDMIEKVWEMAGLLVDEKR